MTEKLERLMYHPEILDALVRLSATLHVLKEIHGTEKVDRLYLEAVEEVRNEQGRRQIN